MDNLQNELSQNNDRVSVVTRYGSVIGGRTSNGAAVFLGMALVMQSLGTIITRNTDRDTVCSAAQAVHES